MSTLLLLLAVLLGAYGVLSVAARHAARPAAAGDRGARALAVLLAFTGAAHFYMTEELGLLMPFWVPGRHLLVYASGVVELLLAVGLALRRTRRWAGWAVIAMLLLLLPVNVWAAWNRVPVGGHEWGPPYLLLRVPFQALLAGWAWWFAARGARDGGG